MFESISQKLEGVFRALGRKPTLTEKNIRKGMREVRMALLEADVNFNVVRDFTRKVTERAVGEEVIRSVSPAQQIVNAESSDDTGDEIERGAVEVNPIAAGAYTLTWNMQIKCNTSGGEASGKVTVKVNGGSAIVVDSGVERDGDWFTISGSVPVDAEDGESYRLAAVYWRAGTAGNAAYVRRVRLFVSRRM